MVPSILFWGGAHPQGFFWLCPVCCGGRRALRLLSPMRRVPGRTTAPSQSPVLRPLPSQSLPMAEDRVLFEGYLHKMGVKGLLNSWALGLASGRGQSSTPTAI